MKPKHIAIIMDGNRRWAKSNNYPLLKAYENQIFNILESFEIDGDIEDVIKKLRIKFDGIKGKKSRFKA